LVNAVALTLGTMIAGGTLVSCRVSDTDVKRWGSTEHGPDKLVAVLTHDKYDWPLRVASALELLEMKPRGGRRVGIPRMVDSLASLAPDERKKIIDGLISPMVAQMKQAVPAAAAGQPAPADPSYPYKDAAIALLTYDKAVLVSDDGARKQLTEALIDWSQHDFDRRLTNSTQMFGMEQMMRSIGAPGVKPFPQLITPDSVNYDRIAALVAELGDQATKEATATKLVDLAKYTTSQTWADKTKPILEDANKASKITPTPAQFAAQLAQTQEEALTRVFAAIKKIGTRPAVDYCLSVAMDKSQPEKRRQAALAALEGRLDRNNASDVDKVLALAGAEDTPDSVKDLAFQRVGEMPRDVVVGRLYPMFTTKKWKQRWVAGSTVLRMSSTDQLGEFMSKLPGGPAVDFAITEPLSYGLLIERMTVKGPKPRDAVMPFLREGGLAARLTALGYFYQVGTKADVSVVAPFENDKTAVPKVDDPEGKWQCAKPDSKDNELKDIKDVGEFVKFCVEPAMKAR
jgi:hypothetical protein